MFRREIFCAVAALGLLAGGTSAAQAGILRGNNADWSALSTGRSV